MPEQRRSSFSEEQSSACRCNCGDNAALLSHSFPPFYTRHLSNCDAQNHRITMTTKSNSHSDLDKFSSATSNGKYTMADPGFCCVLSSVRTNLTEDRSLASTVRSNIPSGSCQHVSRTQVSRALGECQSQQDISSTLWEPDEDGDTVLHLAVIHGEVRLVMYLLGLDGVTHWLDHQNHLHQTALHLSVISQHLLITKLLLQQGADSQVRDRHGNTTLHLACRLGDVASVQVVTSREVTAGIRGAHCVNLRNYAGLTCLHVAASGSYTHVVRHLLQASHIKADVNMPDGCSGRTVLHNAVERRDMGLLCYLLQCQTDIDLDLEAITFGGQTPLSLALGNSHDDIVEFLLLAGALPLMHPGECDDSDSECDNGNGDIEMDSGEYMEYTDFVIGGKKIFM